VAPTGDGDLAANVWALAHILGINDFFIDFIYSGRSDISQAESCTQNLGCKTMASSVVVIDTYR
jgi:hypothetical protein